MFGKGVHAMCAVLSPHEQLLATGVHATCAVLSYTHYIYTRVNKKKYNWESLEDVATLTRCCLGIMGETWFCG